MAEPGELNSAKASEAADRLARDQGLSVLFAEGVFGAFDAAHDLNPSGRMVLFQSWPPDREPPAAATLAQRDTWDAMLSRREGSE